jgi:hypothetical protein
MKPELLTMLLALTPVFGCAGRMNADLLRARIREQSTQLSDSQREIAKTRSELKRSQQESERLQAQLEQADRQDGQSAPAAVSISKLRIHTLASGGLNKDDQPGDDVIVVQFVPLDSDNEPAQEPGDLEFTLIDPRLNEATQQIGIWHFTADECRTHWTRGITSSGFQFSLPLEQVPRHADLIVQVKYQNSDGRRIDASHVIKVVVSPSDTIQMTTARAEKKRPRPDPIQTVQESDEFLPPAGDQGQPSNEVDAADWSSEALLSSPGRAVLHSSNWADATIPQLR